MGSKAEKTVWVVIPVHNRKEATRTCLSCLQQQTYPALRVVVTDDGSTDGTQEMLETEFPHVVRLEGDGNLWWTGGTNRGVQHALDQGADLVVTLNNDVLIKEDYIEKLVQAHRQNPDALIGSLELSQQNPPLLLYAGTKSFNPWTAKYVKYGNLFQPYEGDLKGLLPSYNLSGRGVLIPSEVFEKIGLYDEKRLPHYAADYDFSLRAARRGFRCLLNTENPVFSPYEPLRPGGSAQSWRQFLKSFFEFRSSNYLPICLCYNYRHHPHKWYFPVFITLDIARKLISFSRQRNQ